MELTSDNHYPLGISYLQLQKNISFLYIERAACVSTPFIIYPSQLHFPRPVTPLLLTVMTSRSLAVIFLVNFRFWSPDLKSLSHSILMACQGKFHDLPRRSISFNVATTACKGQRHSVISHLNSSDYWQQNGRIPKVKTMSNCLARNFTFTSR